MIADNSAKSIEAFVQANVKPGATSISDGHASYPGLSGDYRHDPRVVGAMAANILLPWSHRAFSLMKRWALGTYHGLRRKHIDVCLNGRCQSNGGSPTCSATAISRAAIYAARARHSANAAERLCL